MSGKLSAQDRAYREIREHIISGRFPPGSQLRERNLSELTGVSRTPVREALQKLSLEGLVRAEHNRGVFVEKIDIVEVLEVFDVGAALESRCARLAARKISQRNLDLLHASLDTLRNAVDKRPPDFQARFLEADKQFHEILGQATGNRQLLALVRSTISIPVLLEAFKNYEPENFERSARQHAEIFEAIASKDEEWADVAMRNHILAGRNAVLKRLKTC